MALVRCKPSTNRLLGLPVHFLLVHRLWGARFEQGNVKIAWKNSNLFAAWPDNKAKCTELFDYCVTYLESGDKAPFIAKIPVDSDSEESGESVESEESQESVESEESEESEEEDQSTDKPSDESTEPSTTKKPKTTTTTKPKVIQKHWKKGQKSNFQSHF